MRNFIVAIALAALASAGVTAQSAAPRAPAKPFVPGKTTWGDPNLQGIYTDKDENGMPLERPTQFDGTTWGLPKDDLTSVSGAFADVPFGAHDVLQRVRIAGLKGSLLPAAYSATAIDSEAAYWVGDTGTLVVPDGIGRGDQFEIVSSVLDVSPELLRSATSINPPDATALDLPRNFPDEASDAAREITANAPTVSAPITWLRAVLGSRMRPAWHTASMRRRRVSPVKLSTATSTKWPAKVDC